MALYRSDEDGPSDETLLTPAQAAEYLGLSQSALDAAVLRGELTPAPVTGPVRFALEDLDSFLDNQRARAVITGKLTMSLPMQVDVPRLLRTMVTLPDERQAAEVLTNEVTALAGSCCKTTAIYRLDETTQVVRLLALSDFPGRQHLKSAMSSGGSSIEADLLDMPPAFRQAVEMPGVEYECSDPLALIAPVLGANAATLVRQLNLRAGLLFPLLRIGDVHWIVAVLIDAAPTELHASRRHAIAALGVQASVALEAVRLRDDVLHRATRAEALYSTARMLARSEDYGSLLERIASSASRLLASDAGAVLIYHPEHETFTPGASVGLDPDAMTYAANLSATYLVGRVAGSSGPLQVTDASRTTTLSLPRISGGRRTMAVICAPIIHGGEMLGAIEIYSATPRTFSDDDTSLLSAFSHQAAIALSNVQSHEVRRRALMGAVEALASANEARDGYTGEHCKRLAQLAMLIARARGFSEAEVERIGLGAALHDIGKIAVPDAILRKPGPLTDEERTIIQLHPATGQEIVARVPELQDVALMIGAHQERWDGAGYPNRLKGTDIPLGARIIAVVDTYAALVEDRPYREGATHEAALAEIVASSGTQFDPEIVQTFVDVQESVRQMMEDADAFNHANWLPSQRQSRLTGVVTTPNGYLPEHRWQVHRASELVAVNDIIRTIAATTDLSRMYDQVYRKLSDLLDVDAMLIVVAGDATDDTRQSREFCRSPFFPTIGLPVEEEVIAPVAGMRNSLLIDDYLELARERQLQLPTPATDDAFCRVPRSVIAVPILVEDQLLGVLTVQALHPGAYENRHVNLIEDIAFHIGVSMRHHSGDVGETGRLQQDTIAQHWIGELQSQSGPEDAARVFAERVRETVPYDGCIVFLLQQGELGAAAVEGYYSLPERRAYQTYRMPRGVGVFWSVMNDNQSLIVPDLAEDSRGAVLLRPPVPGESALIAPLTASGATIGVIFLTRLAYAFDAADERRLARMSQAAASVLDGFQQRALELLRVRELANLQTALGRITACETSDSVFDTLISSLAEQFSYRFVGIYRRTGDTLILQAQAGYDSVLDRIPIDTGVLARAVRERKSFLIEDVRTDPDFLEAIPGVRSEIAVPIVVDGQVFGGLNVETGRERCLGSWDLALVELLVQQAGSTLSQIKAARARGSGSLTGELEMIDQTTSLATQAALMAGLDADVRQYQGDGQPLAVLFIDLDHFKLANDAYGHRFGDELMGWMGTFLPQELPDDARIGRYAGDAFVAVLPGMTTDAACEIAERLRVTMAERAFETSLGHTVLLSISVGVSGLEPDGPAFATAEELLHAADRAMYAAKLEGRNRVTRWSPDLAARTVLAS